MLQLFTVLLLVTAITAEFTTDEDVSKEIVIPTLFFAAFTGIGSTAVLIKDARDLHKLR